MKEKILSSKNKIILAILLITPLVLVPILAYVSGEDISGKERTNVTIKGYQMLVNGEPFTIKGTGYFPVPIGDDPEFAPYGDYYTSNYAKIHDRDMKLLRDMGANTVRIRLRNDGIDYGDFLDKAYNNGKDPIYVIVSFEVGHRLNLSSLEVRNKLKADFRKLVSKYKSHPAILMWVVGNELNGRWRYSKQKLDDAFSIINEMALEAHLEEGDNYHPVTTSLVDANFSDTIRDYDPVMTNLDLWAVQVYRGKSFGNIFSEYAKFSSKPLAILEYGIDAYDDVHQTEYEDVQAEYVGALWNEIDQSDVAIGGVITAYSDGWWKGKANLFSPQTQPDCPDFDANLHSTCGYTINSHPDRFSNEEWWGIMRAKDNGREPDIMEPRKVYYTLKELWTNKT